MGGRGPASVVWDVTYACPLRCTHCYSESGRRPARQLAPADRIRVVDAMLSLNPRAIVFSGGEPLILPDLAELARRVAAAGVEAHVYTSGWFSDPELLTALLDVATTVTMSLDGPDPEVHDRIRGRVGAFDRALRTLVWLDETVTGRRLNARPNPTLGIDVVVVRSNIDRLSDFCTTLAPRFASLDFLFFGAAVPSGLASTREFADRELLDRGQVERLSNGELQDMLQRRAPRGVEVCASDNAMFQAHPDRIAAGEHPGMHVEPDGAVRALPIYEGTVGTLLEEDAALLWERARRRWRDPDVNAWLRAAGTPREWADATRRID
jgi:MoaA/NifB/PqqE/SkfB family radical SAM enzyme